MKKLIILCLLCLPLFVTARPVITVISLKLTEVEKGYVEESGRKPRIEFSGSNSLEPELLEAQQDQEGNWYFLIPNPREQYAKLTVWGNGQATIFITPGMETEVFVLPDKGFRYKGDGSAINNYLNTAPLCGISSEELQCDEEEFIEAYEKGLKIACQKMTEAKLGKHFTKIEEQRLQLLFACKFGMYASIFGEVNKKESYTPSQHFKEYATRLFHENDELMFLDEYRRLAWDVVTFNWQAPVNIQNREDETFSKINFVLDRFKGEKLREQMIASFVTTHIRNAGLKDTARIEPLFRQYVKNPKMVKIHNDLCSQLTSDTDKILKKLEQQGVKKCPSFKFKDINGKEVALEDFKGKYVYIDCWATWCGPCKKELPYLGKLEEKYKDRNIVFVSISSDKDVAAWKKMVKMDKLGGVQLNIGTDRTFHNALKISSIPRFMLIDPEGNLVSDNAPRPSNSQIEILFDSMKGL
ncbi:TlpA family protein disulfide reductase [Odoribacter splanchnicus]|jgi:thioredoxin family protein|uniref:TlpA family protein disulfide reductase n=1 Tax=Odoribacter splanchnicus TaxID=28118 RepID=UPI000B3A77AD|nr:TlpA disulfide reductase family protein [Odoribacter splanchnicus]MDB9244845.1 TlpA disulfide reductase family protein [Odoribacter splanchnicus]OUO16698.1 hypothetical protein B5F93_01110 [Odoribacter splanchnicus]SPY26143.1 Thiol-disulfide oxidoreductase resA [Odoribacter splanchnicus]